MIIKARGTVVDNGDFDGSDQRVVDTERVAADARGKSEVVDEE